MALDISISALRVALHQANARWTADVTNLTYLQDDQKLLRLGALPPDGIAGLRQREVAAAASKIFLETPVGLPRSWDYRDVDGENFVTPVRDQGSCGSCVAFAVIAAVEAMVLIKMGNFVTVDLSEAQLFYCYAASQGRNCENGWWPQYALPFLRDDGVGDEASFPYSPGNQPCNVASDWRTRAVRITGSHEIRDFNAMKVWLATRGPLIASFALYDDFFSYRSGVYHHVTGALRGGIVFALLVMTIVRNVGSAKIAGGRVGAKMGFSVLAIVNVVSTPRCGLLKGLPHIRLPLLRRPVLRPVWLLSAIGLPSPGRALIMQAT